MKNYKNLFIYQFYLFTEDEKLRQVYETQKNHYIYFTKNLINE